MTKRSEETIRPPLGRWTDSEIRCRFAHHPPDDARVAAHEHANAAIARRWGAAVTEWTVRFHLAGAGRAETDRVTRGTGIIVRDAGTGMLEAAVDTPTAADALAEVTGSVAGALGDEWAAAMGSISVFATNSGGGGDA